MSLFLCSLLGMIVIGLIIHFTNPFAKFDKPQHRMCDMCHIGVLSVRYYGGADQFTETITPCPECGWKPDECEGC